MLSRTINNDLFVYYEQSSIKGIDTFHRERKQKYSFSSLAKDFLQIKTIFYHSHHKTLIRLVKRKGKVIYVPQLGKDGRFLHLYLSLFCILSFFQSFLDDVLVKFFCFSLYSNHLDLSILRFPGPEFLMKHFVNSSIWSSGNHICVMDDHDFFI